MKFRRLAAALLMAALCLSVCLPTGFAASQQSAALGLEVQVQCTGTSIPAETYTLELRARGDAPMPAGTPSGEAAVVTVANDGTSTVKAVFPQITYTRPDYYYYTLRMVPGDDPYGTYDSTVYYLKVKVAYSGDVLRTDVMAFTDESMPADGKKSELLFVNSFASSEPPYIPPTEEDNGDDPVIVPIIPPVPVTPETPPVADAKPETPAAAPVPPAPDTPEGVVMDARPETGPKLIQTGQTNWPVPVLAGSGMVLIAAGVLLTRRDKKRKDENA